jgi:4-diphosphocytidyl-2-C-methyl-D-erythritol kinase
MDSPSLTIHAPAKINLFLALAPRRADGFHPVETIYQAVASDFTDTIELTTQDAGISLTSDASEVPTDATNLCWRAAALLLDKTGVKRGVQINLRKRIPVGAGLGGGSSDAAAVLAGLNELWQLSLSPVALAAYAAELGSDVPFFLSGGTAIGRGRGEELTALAIPQYWFVIAWPGIHLSTAAVYRAWDETPSHGNGTLEEMLASLNNGDPVRGAASLRNDLDTVACRLCPACAQLKQTLLDLGCLAALISGSGAAVFGIAKDQAQAHNIAAALAADRNLLVSAAHSNTRGVTYESN